jgi:hypothetical protein
MFVTGGAWHHANVGKAERMTTILRKLTLTAHVAVSVGWLGAVAGVLALAIAGLTSEDPQVVGAAYLGTELIWRSVLIPFGLAALLTGLVQALGTQWGLFRRSWVLAKFLLTLGAVILLLLHTRSLLPALSGIAMAVSSTAHSASAHVGKLPPQVHLVVAAGGTLLVLIATTTLSVYKPWGMTWYGRRRLHEPHEARVSQP